ncbi:hypothetical protein [Streptacidiphilus sp. EB103A]|uniref:hypothetical protein n=1 Tax=Streptacidiphilus sp. EB103A TaxID=3156275 RepID=UPI003513308D
MRTRASAAALAEINEVFAGRRQFHAVAVTLESDRQPEPPAEDQSMRPRLRRVDLDTGQFTGAWGQADDHVQRFFDAPN